MIVLGLTVFWVGGVIYSVATMIVLALLLAGFLPYFMSRHHPLLTALESLTRPLLWPLRRALVKLGWKWRFDPSPWLAALALWLAGWGLVTLSAMAGQALLPSALAFRATPLGRALSALHYVVYVYMFMVILRVLLSWFRSPLHHPAVRWLFRVTEPALRLANRLLPLRAGMFDLTPLVLLLMLSFLDQVVIQSLVLYASLL